MEFLATHQGRLGALSQLLLVAEYQGPDLARAECTSAVSVLAGARALTGTRLLGDELLLPLRVVVRMRVKSGWQSAAPAYESECPYEIICLAGRAG